MMVTRQGVIKKCELTEFDNPMARGIIALSLDEGDELIAARLTDGNNYVFLGSHEGKAIRFAERHVRAMGRPARGVRAMDLEEGDFLVGMEIVEETGLILSISEHGYGKRTPLKDYRLTARGGKGVINMKTTDRNGKVVAILSVKEDTDIMIITKDGKIIRLESGEIRQAGIAEVVQANGSVAVWREKNTQLLEVLPPVDIGFEQITRTALHSTG